MSSGQAEEQAARTDIEVTPEMTAQQRVETERRRMRETRSAAAQRRANAGEDRDELPALTTPEPQELFDRTREPEESTASTGAETLKHAKAKPLAGKWGSSSDESADEHDGEVADARDDGSDDDADDECVCWICYSGDSVQGTQLISPCKCKGSVKYVHEVTPPMLGFASITHPARDRATLLPTVCAW